MAAAVTSQPAPDRRQVLPALPEKDEHSPKTSCLSDRERLGHCWMLVKVTGEGKIHRARVTLAGTASPHPAALPGSRSGARGMLPRRFGGCREVLSVPTALDGSKH